MIAIPLRDVRSDLALRDLGRQRCDLALGRRQLELCALRQAQDKLRTGCIGSC